MKKRQFGVLDALLLLLSAALLLGTLTLFAPCGPGEDGGWMSCHYAGSAVAGVAAVLTLCALLRILRQDTRPGMDWAMAACAALAAAMPGGLIPLCMMADMRCRAVMTPAVRLLSALLAAAALADLALQRRRSHEL